MLKSMKTFGLCVLVSFGVFGAFFPSAAFAALPALTVQPASKTVINGQSVTFAASATGEPSYQWQQGWCDWEIGSGYIGWEDISGATSATYTIDHAEWYGNIGALQPKSNGKKA